MSTRSPYDVLGIRPNAGRDEIELAYKGRRSQYHPDRYAQADAETQAWANTCMQDVNAAYARLTDPAAPPAQPTTPTPAQEPSRQEPRQTLASALRALPISKQQLDRIYLAPNIPEKKLRNALESYGDGLKPGDVIALLDDTIFSSGKDGLLLTEHQLWIKEAFQPRRMVPLEGVELTFRDGILYASNHRLRDFNITDKGDIRRFVNALNGALASRAAAADATPATPKTTAGAAPQQTGTFRLERHFMSTLERLEQEKGRIDASSREARQALNMLALLQVAIALTDKLQDAAEHVRGAPLGPDAQAWLRSDAVRLELLIYEFSWLTFALKNGYGRSDAQAEHDLDPMLMLVLMPSMLVVHGSDDPDRRRALLNLQHSALMQAFGQRTQHYFDAIAEPGRDIGVVLYQGLTDPVAFAAPGTPPDLAARERWEADLKGACGLNSLERLAREMHQVLGQGLQAIFQGR